MCRGIIGGCVIVSATAIYYKLWISILLGIVGGVIVVSSSQLLQKFKIDDPLQIAQTHGFIAFTSLILITFFHERDGIFFTNIHSLV